MRRLLPLWAAGVVLALCSAAILATGPAQAQFASQRRAPGTPAPAAPNHNDPVAFTADQVQYDRDNGLVTATGNVEAWQNDHILRADKITFDRNTNVAAATGHVVLIEPDGQILFSDYAELTEGMRDGVLRGMRAILAENGKLVANGARRTGGTINEMSRAVYTTCDLCAKDPTKPPLWQIRARSAVQDTENQVIEYRDAVMDIYGIPVAAFPYFWHADPSVKRASGFLVPTIGDTSHLGGFLSLPYYQVIDENSDATITPTLSTENFLNLSTNYRRKFNDGILSVDLAIGNDHGLQADLFSKGRFSYDDTWRYGFDLARASNATYLSDYNVSNRGDVLTSRIYIEGFGTGAYTKLDSIAYQGLVASINQSALPYVLPRYEYSYFNEIDPLGGRLSFDTTDFNVYRAVGTSTQRAGGTLNWQRPFDGLLGEKYNLTLQSTAAGYKATSFNDLPNFSASDSTSTAQAQPQVALKMNWPFIRDGGALGTQLIEPIVQVIAAPNVGSTENARAPDEDSLDFEFTDATLFSLNRFAGIDRTEGGVRVNAALHANWTFGGSYVDGLIGDSYHEHLANIYLPESGLNTRFSDIVTRTTISPVSWFDTTFRTRLDATRLTPRFVDAQASTGVPLFRVSGGYIYTATNPYYEFDQAATPTAPLPASYFVHRNEVTLSAVTTIDHYKLTAYGREDINLGKPTAVGLRGTYEDECFIFDINFNRRYTSLNGDNGSTSILFQITFKTVGQFGYHAS
jgi:LPS-assembly protein